MLFRSDSGAALIVEVDGTAAATDEEIARVEEACRSAGATDIRRAGDDAERDEIWLMRRELSAALKNISPVKLNNDVVVPRGRVPELFTLVETIRREANLPIACFGHAGDGNIHVNIMADRYNRDDAVREKVEHALDDLFAQVLAWGGVITGEHGIGLAKKRWWPEATSQAVRDVHRRLKQILDPNDILNPGKFV